MFLIPNHIQDYSRLWISFRTVWFESSWINTKSIACSFLYRSRGASLTGHIQTSTLPRILSGASASDCHSHPLTFHLYLRPDVLPPRFQYAVLHPSFLRRFHLPSLYISHTFSSPFFFQLPPPLLLLPFAVPLPPKQSSFFLPLYLHDRGSVGGRCGWQKAGFFKTVQVLISSPCFSSQPKSFIAELTVIS